MNTQIQAQKVDQKRWQYANAAAQDLWRSDLIAPSFRSDWEGKEKPLKVAEEEKVPRHSTFKHLRQHRMER